MKYAVWVGGSEIGTYATEDDAIEVADDWRLEGYTDVEIDEVDADEETPEQMNARLLSMGY